MLDEMAFIAHEKANVQGLWVLDFVGKKKVEERTDQSAIGDLP